MPLSIPQEQKTVCYKLSEDVMWGPFLLFPVHALLFCCRRSSCGEYTRGVIIALLRCMFKNNYIPVLLLYSKHVGTF